MKKASLFLLPLFVAILIFSSLALSIHSYRNSFAPGKYADPAEPRLQSPVTIRIPENLLPHASENPDSAFYLLDVTKIHSALFSTHYWPEGETILSVPVQTEKGGIRLRLSLWDAGQYTIRLRDPISTHTVLSFPINVRTPLRLYRNDLILAGLISILAWGSGWIARGFAPMELLKFSRKTGSVWIFFFVFLSSGILLMGFSLSSSRDKASNIISEKKVASPVPLMTQETEGRIGIPPIRLFPDGPPQNIGGLLIIRHRLDSWSDYGRISTLFEGTVPGKFHSQAFLLLPDDGRYRLTLWSPEKGTNMTGVLSRSHWIVRAIPSSPPFPISLFSGMALFSIAFFLKGISYYSRRRSPETKVWGEVS
ncbi:MAG: hypothetical protein ACYCYP_03725 [Leptospirales bacterium]